MNPEKLTQKSQEALREAQSLAADKGAAVLSMLRWVLGDAQYNKTVRQFMFLFAGKPAGAGAAYWITSLLDVAAQTRSGATARSRTESTPTPGEPTKTTLSAARPLPVAAFPTSNDP